MLERWDGAWKNQSTENTLSSRSVSCALGVKKLLIWLKLVSCDGSTVNYLRSKLQKAEGFGLIVGKPETA